MEESLKKRINILNAMYFSSSGSELLYNQVSPFNTFRYVLNLYFEEDYHLLENKNYYSSYKSPYKFLDVTGRGIFE